MSLVFSVPDHSDKMERHIEDLSHTLKDDEYLEGKNSMSACVARPAIRFSLDASYLLLIGCQLTNQRMHFRHKHFSGLQLLPETGP